MLASPPRNAELCNFPFDTPNTPSDHVYPETPSSQITPQPAQGSLLVSDDLDLDELRSTIAGTRGYYARDYSLGLGWNNMRYIIETAIHHGSLLNRTVLIPSYIYARSCEYENAVCTAHAQIINRGDAINSDEWRNLPQEQQMGWKVPMSVMLNLTHLRRSHPVITVAEYLRLHDLSPELELSNGQWDTQKFHQNPSVDDTQGKPPSLHVIENGWYDPQDLNRVDRLTEEMKSRGQWDSLLGDPAKDEHGGWPSPIRSKVYLALEQALSGRQHVLEFDRARDILQNNGVRGVTSDEGLIQVLNDNGWEVLYTFDGALGMDYVKNVVDPIKQVAPRDSIRGFVDDYYDFTEDVLLLRGEIHYERKPASLRFTSTPARDAFARLVLYQLRHIDSVMELSAVMARRMQERVGGRMWMGAHMRRGDFVRYNWAMQPDFGDHLQRINDRLDAGRDILQSITAEPLATYAIPDVAVNPELIRHHPPQKDDSIYVATDERDPGNLAYLRDHGVVRAPDLITIEDRRRFGWPLLITDVLGIVEQDLLARATFFYAHALSSVGGGVINIRAASGADPRTARVD
ncbi:hypothetical protein EV363DRAFT_1179181 [Boletus edulis]|uniref:Uncharacterized protein n=1 Tax=Boletus edulis BED1 TaxID=1328754 RepID=A0AAD4BK77_BOLED|nr:hypothetical protein EV363DRAFT_1179181 [Boletus edulis]KAF8432431.1 hypothetical protein L210DRAFT_3413890 [Boletus edulis BED1]